MVKGKKSKLSAIDSLSVMFDGVLNLDQPKYNTNHTKSNKGINFKRTNKSKSKISASKMKIDKKPKKMPKRRTLSARNADETLSSALDKLGLGTKKKRKRRRSKTKKN